MPKRIRPCRRERSVNEGSALTRPHGPEEKEHGQRHDTPGIPSAVLSIHSSSALHSKNPRHCATARSAYYGSLALSRRRHAIEDGAAACIGRRTPRRSDDRRRNQIGEAARVFWHGAVGGIRWQNDLPRSIAHYTPRRR